MIDTFYPQVGVATVNLLRRLGVEVKFPMGQTCCGQPAYNGGYHNEAEVIARKFRENGKVTSVELETSQTVSSPLCKTI